MLVWTETYYKLFMWEKQATMSSSGQFPYWSTLPPNFLSKRTIVNYFASCTDWVCVCVFWQTALFLSFLEDPSYSPFFLILAFHSLLCGMLSFLWLLFSNHCWIMVGYFLVTSYILWWLAFRSIWWYPDIHSPLYICIFVIDSIHLFISKIYFL